MARVDHQINANNTWAVRWLRETSPQTNQLVSTNYTLRRAEEEQDTDWTIVGTLNSVIANTRVNTLKLSYTHEDVFFGNPGYFETDDQAALGPLLVHQTFEDGIAPAPTGGWIPPISSTRPSRGSCPARRANTTSSSARARYYLPLHVFDAGTLNGTFAFSASDATSMRPIRAPIRTASRFACRASSDFFVKGTEIGVFVQDKWKLNSRLTVSLGLRYDVEIVPDEQHRQLPVLDGSRLAGRQEQRLAARGRHLDPRQCGHGRHSRRIRPLSIRRCRTRTSRRSSRRE